MMYSLFLVSAYAIVSQSVGSLGHEYTIDGFACLDDQTGNTGWAVNNWALTGCNWDGCTLFRESCVLTVAVDITSNERYGPNTTKLSTTATFEILPGIPVTQKASEVLNLTFLPNVPTHLTQETSVSKRSPKGKYKIAVRVTDIETNVDKIRLSGTITIQ